MTARAYEITLISATERIVRHVVAHRPVQATLTVLRMAPEINAPLAVICKPLTEKEPCLS